MAEVKIDEIGYWSEIKLDILKEYASAYSRILAARPEIRSHVYIDGFAGAGTHLSRTTGDYIPGSPLNALLVEPPFREFHFIDLDGGRAKRLEELASGIQNVHVYEGDCNTILLNKVFPSVRYRDFRRALCLLDPYGLNLRWEVLKTAGQEKSIEIFLNFMVMDMNMNVLKHDPSKVREDQISRMNVFWGDTSWRDAAYTSRLGLFGPIESKNSNETLAGAFQKRLKDVAGFAYVPDPIPMRNGSGAVVYYLFFASANRTGAKIVNAIFDKYRNVGAR